MDLVLEKGLHPEIIISLERTPRSVERALNMEILKARIGSTDQITIDWSSPWALDDTRPLNLKLSTVSLAVKGQFK